MASLFSPLATRATRSSAARSELLLKTWAHVFYYPCQNFNYTLGRTTFTWVCAYVRIPVHAIANKGTEMSLNIDTIGGRISDHCYNDSILTSNVRTSNGREKIIIDGRYLFCRIVSMANLELGLDIVANRLFGPRPATSTYVCIWEIRVGDVKASLSPYEIAVLSSVGSAFGLNFSDPLNAPAKEYAIPSDPDGRYLSSHSGH